MNEKLDLTELLKDCPKGMELDSIVFNGVVTFNGIINDEQYPIEIKIDNIYKEYLDKYGRFIDRSHFKCVIFPKGKTTWEGFQRPFVDGDIVYANVDDISYILIYYKQEDNTIYRHVCFCLETNTLNYGEHIFTTDPVSELRLATEEETQELFNTIKAKGYKWNEETKTLEKLIVPKFKVGDIIRKKDGTKECVITKISGDSYDYVTSKTYKSPCFIKRERGYFPIDRQDDYELIPDKFNPEFLNPFDKVLCRMNNDDIWGISLFERYAPTNPYPFFCIQDCFSQCVPYNDNTKHLVGTNNEAPEYYKCWED